MHRVRAVLQRIGLAYPPVIFVFTPAVTVAAAYLSHRYYESRFLGLKDRFSRLRPAPRKKPEWKPGPATSQRRYIRNSVVASYENPSSLPESGFAAAREKGFPQELGYIKRAHIACNVFPPRWFLTRLGGRTECCAIF
jgi:hypothetical protein